MAKKRKNPFQAMLDNTQVAVMEKAAYDILDLKKELTHEKSEVEHWRKESARYAEECRSLERDIQRLNWLVEHLADYGRDIERIAEE